MVLIRDISHATFITSRREEKCWASRFYLLACQTSIYAKDRFNKRDRKWG